MHLPGHRFIRDRPGTTASSSDEDRTRLLLPFVPKIIGTKGSEALEERRSLMAADWLVRVHTPALLRLGRHERPGGHASCAAGDHQRSPICHATRVL